LERFDVFRCAILAASYAAVSMVVQLETYGLEARFWTASASSGTFSILNDGRTLEVSNVLPKGAGDDDVITRFELAGVLGIVGR